MALRNAFEAVATESTLRRLLAVASYARDVNARLRVVIYNAPPALLYRANSRDPTVNRHPFGDVNAVFMVDEREQQRVQSEQSFNQVRTQRWSFS